jgi:hypothetical protein
LLLIRFINFTKLHLSTLRVDENQKDIHPILATIEALKANIHFSIARIS